MFPDYAESVLWYAGGPVDYDTSQLDGKLIAELESWDASYYAGLKFADETWRSRALRNAYETEGVRLAQRVAEALGKAFAVDFNGRIFRSKGYSEAPAAAAAFTALADKEEAWQEELARQLAQGETFYWSATGTEEQ